MQFSSDGDRISISYFVVRPNFRLNNANILGFFLCLKSFGCSRFCFIISNSKFTQLIYFELVNKENEQKYIVS